MEFCKEKVNELNILAPKDISDNMIAVGNPCKVTRKITDKDRDFFCKERKFDVEDY